MRRRNSTNDVMMGRCNRRSTRTFDQAALRKNMEDTTLIASSGKRLKSFETFNRFAVVITQRVAIAAESESSGT